MSKSYDVIIVGAGPAGAACAFQLAGKGLRIAVIDKAVFPRDKICGDAISPDVVNQLYRMDPTLGANFDQFEEKNDTHGIRFYGPNKDYLDISFNPSNYTEAPGFIIKRTVFDDFLFKQIESLPDVDIYLEHQVKTVLTTTEDVQITTDKISLTGRIVVGADGAHSIVKKELIGNKIDKKHHSAGLRQYYENVTGFHEKNHIELHFIEHILPGYFWIFPLPNNQANVGLGMLSSEVSKRNVNLKEKLAEIIEHHPSVKERFKNAQPLEKIKGFGLPMGSKKRACSGHRFILLGDAASLVDPFSGEGIGNAIRSGRLAAEHLEHALKIDRLDATYNKRYDKKLYSKMWKELRFSYYLRNIMQHPRVFNFLLKKGTQSIFVKNLLTSILDNRDFKKSLLSPSFYYKLFSKV